MKMWSKWTDDTIQEPVRAVSEKKFSIVSCLHMRFQGTQWTGDRIRKLSKCGFPIISTNYDGCLQVCGCKWREAWIFPPILKWLEKVS